MCSEDVLLTAATNVEKDTAVFLAQAEQVVIYWVPGYSEPVRGTQ